MFEFKDGTIFRLTPEEIESLQKILHKRKNLRILEIGAYHGHTSTFLSELCQTVFSWNQHDKNSVNDYFVDTKIRNGIQNVMYFEFIDFEDIVGSPFDFNTIFIDYLLTEDWTDKIVGFFNQSSVLKIIRKIDDYENLVEKIKETHEIDDTDFFVLCDPKKETPAKKSTRSKKNSTT